MRKFEKKNRKLNSSVNFPISSKFYLIFFADQIMFNVEVLFAASMYGNILTYKNLTRNYHNIK